MKPRDLALLFLEKAWADEVAATRLAPMEDVADSIIGFHAQQAVEKSLKAVLALQEIRVNKTHNIATLSAQIKELGMELPPGIDDALELTAYAVLERYPLGAEVEPLDRSGALALAHSVREWASALVGE